MIFGQNLDQLVQGTYLSTIPNLNARWETTEQTSVGLDLALFDNKQRLKAEKAIKKALQLQVENKGFAFVEVLAECPTHLKMTPEESEKWVKEKMLPIFPLGVKKDVPGRDWSPELVHPRFDAQELLKVVDAHGEGAPRFMQGFPRQVFGPDVAMKLAGSGGDGAQTAAMLLCRAAINEGFDATHIPSYGPESRGGTSYADVHMAEDEVLSPAAPHPHVLVAFNAPSLAKFGPMVAPGGVIVYDSSVIHELPKLEPGQTLPEPLRTTIEAVGALPASVVALDAPVRLSAEGELSFDVAKGRTIRFGDGREAGDKFVAIASMLGGSVDMTGYCVLDVRLPSTPKVVRAPYC